jgi:hypothetical protein
VILGGAEEVRIHILSSFFRDIVGHVLPPGGTIRESARAIVSIRVEFAALMFRHFPIGVADQTLVALAKD